MKYGYLQWYELLHSEDPIEVIAERIGVSVDSATKEMLQIVWYATKGLERPIGFSGASPRLLKFLDKNFGENLSKRLRDVIIEKLLNRIRKEKDKTELGKATRIIEKLLGLKGRK